MIVSRLILWFLLSIVLISVLRAVLGVVGKFFASFIEPHAPQARRPSVPSGGELKKDPVCGTFISTATALQKKIGGTVYYFCSAECRDKFKS